ncbi:hypothetical protein [Escherichia coli]|uniref:hypothetical protein n=1 Tax=Escherichia coli TaxID=562 RepID=UPI000D700947|nr:hypothetical protein [Escherichia coli]
MGSCAAPSAKGDDKFITTDYLQQCPVFYCVPAALYEQMLDELDEKDLVQTITERQNQPLREVDLNQYL